MRNDNSAMVLGGMSVTLERLEAAARHGDFESVLLATGRLREQESELRKALLTETLRLSIEQVRARKQCAVIGSALDAEKAHAANVSPFQNTKTAINPFGE